MWFSALPVTKLVLCLDFLSTCYASIPTWPQPTSDEIEDVAFVTLGYRGSGFATGVTPCSFFGGGSGRANAAEWVRTAYHDMATADVKAGTGGLDASIAFETNRGENIGAAFNTTIGFMVPFYTARTSMADLLALAVYTAVTTCGGPMIPFRAGRVDAQKAGPLGVPQPNETLSTLEGRFAKGGFNRADMITLVACGHTLGGVHSEDFPGIVPEGSVADDVAHFDTTHDVFDTKVATEYLNGTTSNPLIVGPAGTNSDKLVFAADGNATMKSLTNPTAFINRCASVFTRMIDTVPRGVILTPPLIPYPVKPVAVTLQLLSDGTLSFAGDVRVHTVDRPTTAIEKLQLVYKDRKGGSDCGNCTIDAVPSVSRNSQGVGTGLVGSFQFYTFTTPLCQRTGISSFEVHITLFNGTVEVHNNNGGRFPIEDSVVALNTLSCVSQITDKDSPWNLTVLAAIRKDRAHLPVSFDLRYRTSRFGSLVEGYTAAAASMKSWKSFSEDYWLFRGSYTEVAAQGAQSIVYNIVSGKRHNKIVHEYQRTFNVGSSC